MNCSRFTRYGAVAIALNLCACGYILPDSGNAPRYNSVLGERHIPSLNPQGGQPAAAPQGGQSAVAAPSAPQTAQASMPDLPPVDESTRARAAQEIGMAQVMPVAVNNLPPAESMPATASSVPSNILNGNRHVPSENPNAPMEVSANDYPPLASVPPRPPLTGENSTAARLGYIRTELEADRAQANNERDRLAHDVSAEPPLGPLPSMTPEITGTMPPAMLGPVPTSAPVTRGVNMPQSSLPPASMTPVANAAPSSPVFAPPPAPLMAQSASPSVSLATTPTVSAPAPISVASIAPPVMQEPTMQTAAPSFQPSPMVPNFSNAPAPMAAPTVTAYNSPNALPPIQLHPPVSAAVTAPAPSFSPTPNNWATPAPAMASSAGSFDPMANSGRASSNSNASSVYASSGYLPSPRYAYER